MDTTLVINPGSASKKYALYANEKRVLEASFERVGDAFSACVVVNGMQKECDPLSDDAYYGALETFLSLIREKGAPYHPDQIQRVGIRIVAPGSYFTAHRRIDGFYEKRLNEMKDAAPLHIPHMQREIEAVRTVLPHAVLYGISDSAFHATIPSHARLYGIPEADARMLDVYRYGYHGLSVGSVARVLKEKQERVPSRTVVCHIGSGVSVTALRDGVSMMNSMGFGPTSGLFMGTRAGDLDPSALLYLMKKKKLSLAESESYVHDQAGFRGLVGSNDLRIVLDYATRGDGKAKEVVDAYFYQIQKQIGSALVTLRGIDAIVLTATASVRNPEVRRRVVEGLESFGVRLDTDRNDHFRGSYGVVSTEESPVQIFVIETEEMDEIVRIVEEME
jgi:acetate kinase